MAVPSDNSANTSSNTSLNSLADKHWGVEARVFHVIDESEIELRPIEIARKIHAPRKPTRAQCTTVRVVLRKLLAKGLNPAALRWKLLQQNHLRAEVHTTMRTQHQSTQLCLPRCEVLGKRRIRRRRKDSFCFGAESARFLGTLPATLAV